MVKTYLKYQIREVIGQISGKNCKICASPDGKFLYSGCNEFVLIVDTKTGLVIKKILDPEMNNKSQVTCIIVDESNSHLAVGYNSGAIVLYDIKNEYAQEKRFSLHKSAISCLQFNRSLNILASGSKDTNIFIWDIIGETILYKLSGHKDNINKILFHNIRYENMEESEILISSSKDNTIKIWNIKSQESIQTIADLVNKVTDFLIFDNVLILGSFDQKLRLYQTQKTIKEKDNNCFVLKGQMTRQSSSKIISIQISSDCKVISILSNDNTIEFLKILSPSELKRRLVKVELDKLKKNVKREKLVAKDNYNELSEKVKSIIENEEYNFKYKFYSLFKFIGENKICSQIFIKNFSATVYSKNVWKFCLGLGNNSIEIYELTTNLIEQNIFIKNNFAIEEKQTSEDNLSVQKAAALENYGHREIMRYVKFSEKDNLVLTASNEGVRLWNYSSLNVIKALNLKNIISGDFILDDRYVNCF
jgi:U3 small nucleolar RNA-associated protein 12